ncbi:ATP-binding cassette domain-containing protein, partial [Rhizobium johnstonii]
KQPVTARDDIIRFEGIVKHFGGAQALAGASLIVRRGTIHGLVVQNGAGKSTLIKLLAGRGGGSAAEKPEGANSTSADMALS